MPERNPALDWFESKMIQLWLSFRARRVCVAFWFLTVEEVRDFINENWLEALRLAKAGFWRRVCEELAKLPYLIQTHEEAKRVIALVESLQVEIELHDFVMDHLKATLGSRLEEEIAFAKAAPGYQKLVAKQ